MDSLLSFSITCKLDLSGLTSILNLYCLIKTSTMSYFFTLIFSNHIYKVRAALLRLSWKKWINSLSSSTTSVILLQYALRWVIEHWIPIYLTNYSTQNVLGMTTLGTKHILVAFIGSYRQVPSNSLIICSKVANLSKPSFFTILPLCDSFSIESMVDDILCRINAWLVEIQMTPYLPSDYVDWRELQA